MHSDGHKNDVCGVTVLKRMNVSNCHEQNWLEFEYLTAVVMKK
jgi:hypothetical protein